MRDILYRGKRKDNGEWVTGYFVKTTDGSCFIVPELTRSEGKVPEAIPETVGEFTGRCDKNGTQIFENDIVKINGWWDASGPAGYDKNLTVVNYDDDICGFNPMCNYDCDCGVYHYADDCEVIGNIHDNPELLEVK